MRINLHELLNATDPDLTVYEVRPGEREKNATISIANWKTALLAINVLSRRVDGLLKDIERAEARIEDLERTMADLQEE